MTTSSTTAAAAAATTIPHPACYRSLQYTLSLLPVVSSLRSVLSSIRPSGPARRLPSRRRRRHHHHRCRTPPHRASAVSEAVAAEADGGGSEPSIHPCIHPSVASQLVNYIDTRSPHHGSRWLAALGRRVATRDCSLRVGVGEPSFYCCRADAACTIGGGRATLRCQCCWRWWSLSSSSSPLFGRSLGSSRRGGRQRSVLASPSSRSSRRLASGRQARSLTVLLLPLPPVASEKE